MPVVGQYFSESGRNVDERIAIRVARFDQRDRSIGVLGEITRNDAASSARANNDNIVCFVGHQRLPRLPRVSFDQQSEPAHHHLPPAAEIVQAMLLAK